MAYKVMNKLRAATPALTGVLDPGILEELIHSLFPTDTDERSDAFLEIPEWDDEWDVTPAEVHHVLIRRESSNAAPGPDGISNKIWKLIPNSLVDLIAKILTGCLRTGVFPDLWKTARLVLIPKDPSNMEDIPKARPICLLDEIGKFFERIILRRIELWMQDKEGILSQNQFGFRRNRSTTDALMMVTNLIKEEISTGGVAIVVSIDIKNAFNSLPWTQIRSTLTRRKFPRYLKRILHAYLSKRMVEYATQDGSIEETIVSMGVPQGSVIGPYLWNVTYDRVLRVDKLAGTEVICYADDTLVIAVADSFDDAKTKACIMLESSATN